MKTYNAESAAEFLNISADTPRHDGADFNSVSTYGNQGGGMTMETRITSLIVLPEGEPIFSERATIVRIEDEAGGEYIVVSQDSIPGRGNVAINPEEWPDIRDAIERMMKECRD